MDKIVDHLFVFRGDGEIQDFPGNYSDFRIYEDSQPSKKELEAAPAKAKNDWKKDTSKAALSYNEQKEHSRLERDIAQLERDREALQAKFATENWEGEEINKQSAILQKIIDDIAMKEMRWFELSEKLEGDSE